MDKRYKKKAYLGVAVWLLSPLAIILPAMVWTTFFEPADKKSDLMSGLMIFAAFLVAPLFAFCWGGSQLAMAKGYSKAVLIPGLVGPPGQLLMMALLLFAMPDKCPDPLSAKPKRRPRRNESPIARIVRYRRNAFVANVFGLTGILLAMLLVFLPLPLTETAEGSHLVALGFFVPSYAGIIFGCYYWVKAKHWSEAVLLIGLLPLAILFIPYVRLIYVSMPLILPLGMAFMPVIMLGVIAALPDKSGLSTRSSRERSSARHQARNDLLAP